MNGVRKSKHNVRPAVDVTELGSAIQRKQNQKYSIEKGCVKSIEKLRICEFVMSFVSKYVPPGYGVLANMENISKKVNDEQLHKYMKEIARRFYIVVRFGHEGKHPSKG